MYRETIRQSIMGIVEPLLQMQGFALVELQLNQRKGQWLIRVFIDAEGGISLEDCQRLSRTIEQALDAEALMAIPYVLEVSSPGLDRPLRTSRDFQHQHQRMVTVFLNSPHMGQTRQTGRVAAVTVSHLVLHLPPDTPHTIPLSQINYGVVELEFK